MEYYALTSKHETQMYNLNDVLIENVKTEFQRKHNYNKLNVNPNLKRRSVVEDTWQYTGHF